MKLLKITLAVIATSAISSAVLADATSTVIYQSGVSLTPAAVIYNGQTIHEGGSIKQDIGTTAHTSVFQASAGMDIKTVNVPCTLVSGQFDGTSASDQMLLTYDSMNVLQSASDSVKYTLTDTNTACGNSDGVITVDGAGTGPKYVDLSLTGLADQVSYTVTAVGHSDGDAPVSGTFSGTVTITTTAEL